MQRRAGLQLPDKLVEILAGAVMASGTGIRRADRDAVGLKPGKDRSADVLGWTLEPCGCGSIDGARQLSRAKHRQPGIVFGSHGHERYLTDWLSIRNDFVLVRTLIRGKEDRGPSP